MTTIYVTPYNVPTKECQAVSGTLPGVNTIAHAETLLAPPNARIVSRSDRLILIDLDGTNGLALSDIPYVCN